MGEMVMRKKFLLRSTLLLLLSTLTWAAGPMPDTIKVTFPFPVVVWGDHAATGFLRVQT
jgi:hypothetical protein